MPLEVVLGLAYIVIGAACGGSFGLPSKFVKPETPWEVLWGPFFFFVTLLLPLLLTPLVVRDLGSIYGQAGMATLVPVLLFGLLWGLGSMTLGMSFALIGLSLAYALNYGAQIITGSMLPLLLFDAEQVLTLHGGVILAGVAVCLAGVAVSGRAGILKQRSLDSLATDPVGAESLPKQPKMLLGVLIGVVSGVLCACYAVASAFAGPIGAVAAETNPPWAAATAVTAIILWGGAVSSCVYCAVQLTRNKTWGRLVGPGAGHVLLLAAIMAVLHNAAIFLFGLGWIHIGELGVSVGYPIFMSVAILVGNVHGFRSGEWKGASRESILWILTGIALLIVGVCLLAQGRAMLP